MIITIEPLVTSILYRKEDNSFFEFGTTREQFKNNFLGIDYSSFVQLSYEPEKNLFHIIENNYSLTALENPSDDDRMNYIHTNADNIKTWFINLDILTKQQNEALEQQRLSGVNSAQS